MRSRRISCLVNGFLASWPNPFPPKTQQVESKNVAKTICFFIGVPPLPLNGVSLIGIDCVYISWIAYACDRGDARCPVRATALTIVLAFIPELAAQVEVPYGSARQPTHCAERTKRKSARRRPKEASRLFSLLLGGKALKCGMPYAALL